MRHWGLSTCQVLLEVRLRRQSKAPVSPPWATYLLARTSLGQDFGNASSLVLVVSAGQVIIMGHTDHCVPPHGLPGELSELSIL